MDQFDFQNLGNGNNRIEEDITSFKWCAYDTHFTPNKFDTRFTD